MKNIIFLLIPFLFYGCISEAPHDNILDPESKNFENFGKITGNVSTYYQPFSPLANAFIQIDSMNLSTRTDKDGFFEITNIPSGTYKVKSFYYGYRTDSATVTISNNIQDINFNLNALPAFESITVNSHHVSRWFPAEDFYYLAVSVNVSDLDGTNELDSVKIDIPSIGFTDTLFSTGANGLYQQTIFENQMPVQTMRSLEGIPMHFICWDRVNNKTLSSDKYIPRIVQDVPVIISPTALQVINNFPTEFSWEQIFLEYDFNLKIEIYQINIGIFSKVREYNNILPNTATFMVNQSLPPGDYFWVIYIVDEFGDTSSSKEGSFRVQ